MKNKTPANAIHRKPKFSAQWELHALMLPAMIVILIFSYFPMYGIILAFKEYNPRLGVFGSEWVQFKHFIRLFEDPFFERSLWNSVGMSFFRIFLLFPLPIFLALMFNEIRSSKIKRVYQTVSYFPYFISWAVVCTMLQLWLSPSVGWVNPLLQSLGVIDKPITFLSEDEYFWPITLISECWKNIGFNTIIFLAAIASVDQEQYEAATIDGASRFKKICYITWPAISGTVTLLFILQIPGIIGGNFDISYLLGNAGNAEASDILQTLIYRKGMQELDYGYSTAASLVTSITSLILLVVGNKVVKSITKRGMF
ncbi:MAG: sugar ABC transporter permease [Ruminococcaceae bacterium]|nr:sugar ABC transporter permease [Oscillospiraceae bacterium]